MANEIELKYFIEPKKVNAFLLLPELLGLTPNTKHLHSIYYDTADYYLLKNKYILLIRRNAENYLQIVKQSGKVENGLHQRQKWTWPVKSFQLDLTYFPINDYLKTLKLISIFVTDFERSKWIIDYHGSTIEVCLDQGKIYRPGCDKFLPISEIELELLNGDISVLLTFGASIQATLGLQPENISKAEKGYKLISYG